MEDIGDMEEEQFQEKILERLIDRRPMLQDGVEKI